MNAIANNKSKKKTYVLKRLEHNKELMLPLNESVRKIASKRHEVRERDREREREREREERERGEWNCVNVSIRKNARAKQRKRKAYIVLEKQKRFNNRVTKILCFGEKEDGRGFV